MAFCLRETKESHFLASWMFWERLAATARTCNPCPPYKRKWMKFVQSQNVISLSVFRYYTSSNQRLGIVFNELDPRLSLLCDVIRPCKIICGGCQLCVPRSIHPRQRCPIQSRLKSLFSLHFSLQSIFV